ncbi:MAG: hypothetical protein H6865_02885 [Rhodospirillales bacterium]|nr:hypothetical protein [Rhodospirillales bacterium]
MLPYTWGYDTTTSLAKLQDESFKDPYIIGISILTALRDPQLRNDPARMAIVEGRFNRFLDSRNKDGYWPHDAYDSFPAGWYSGMDFSGMGLAALALYEATGNDKYLAAGNALMDQLIRPVDAHGALHKTDTAKCWLGEFVWPEMSNADQNYVLNGFLVSLEALAIYAKAEPDHAAYTDITDCAFNDLKSNISSFFFKDGSWSYYMLSPHIPNHTRYIIFETNQFDALYRLTGDAFYKGQAARRRSIFSKNYQVFSHDGQFLFSELGTPQPYLRDIYQTRLTFFDRDGGTLADVSSGAGNTDAVRDSKLFLTGPVPKGTDRVRLDIVNGGSQISMFDAPLAQVSGKTDPLVLQTGNEALIGMQKDADGYLVLNPPAQPEPQTQGRLTLDLNHSIDTNILNLFTIDAESSEPIYWALGLVDESGRETYRYLPQITKAGHFTVPLSRYGFQDPETVGSTVKRVVIYLYANALTKPIRFKFNGITVWPDYYSFAKNIKKLGYDHLLVENL